MYWSILNASPNNRTRNLIRSCGLCHATEHGQFESKQVVQSSISLIWLLLAVGGIYALAFDAKYGTPSKSKSVLAQVLGDDILVVKASEEAAIRSERAHLKAWLESRFPEDQYRITLDDYRPGYRSKTGGEKSSVAPVVLYRVERRIRPEGWQKIVDLGLHVHRKSMHGINLDECQLMIHAVKRKQGHAFEYPVVTAVSSGPWCVSGTMDMSYTVCFYFYIGHMKIAYTPTRVLATMIESSESKWRKR